MSVRVLMVAACPLPWPRGTPIRIHRMAEALTEHGHDVTVMTYPLGDGTDGTSYRVQRVGVGSTMEPAPGPTLKKLLLLDPLLTAAIARILRRETFDVIHAHHYEGLLAGLIGRTFARSRLPLIFDAHTLLGSELPHYQFGLPRRALAMAGTATDRWLPRRAEHVIAVTERMREWFTTEGGLDSDRVTLISNGVESDHFVAGTGVVGARTGYQPPRLLFAGNLAGYQGIELLLEAFARVRAVRRDVELVFVTGSDVAALQTAAAAAGLDDAVRFMADDYARLPGRLAGADVLVNPRVDADGVPQKLLNYMAAGRPIVSFAGSAAVLEHEHTGLIVPDGATDAFAAAVLRLLDDPTLGARLGSAARERVVAAHGWQHVGDEVTAVYRAALDGVA